MRTVRLQSEMSRAEALRVLGFREGDWISPHLPVFRRVEERLVELIESAGSDEVGAGYREELARLNGALRVIEEDAGRERRPGRKGAVVLFVLSLVLVGGLLGTAWWGNEWVNARNRDSLDRRVESLLAAGRVSVEKRRWPEAAEAFNGVLALVPDSQRAREGLRSIEEGKGQEQRQAVGYWLGTVQAAMEARNWDEAETAVGELVKIDPGNDRVEGLREEIRDGRTHDKVVRILEAAEEAIREEQWESLARHTSELELLAPGHVDLPRIRELTREGMKLLEDRREKARRLYLQALEMATDSYSEETLELLREAMRLEPRPEYQALYRKLSSFARTLRVPEEFETIGAALASARGNDKLIIGEGTFEEALTFPVAVDMEGAGPGKTIILFPGTEASVVTISRQANRSRLAGITLRQSGMALTEERFPVVAVDGAEVEIEDCRVENGSGHGIAVLGGGSALLRNVRVSKCAWDGLAISGQGSKAEVIEGRFEANLHHGIDAWEGGAVKAVRTRCIENGLTGLVMMSAGVLSTLEGCTSEQNRELGVLAANGTQAVLMENQVLSNLLGGVLVRDEGTRVSLYKNRVLKNGEAGIVVDRESTVDRFEANEVKENAGEQIRLKAALEQGQ